MEEQYLSVLAEVLREGTVQRNRTGIDTLRIEGAHLQFDLRDGFPAITTKKLAFKTVVGELIGFVHGFNNAAQFRELGCKIWDQNANENQAWLSNPYRRGEDDLGRIYGVQWRDWQHFRGTVDQLKVAVEKVQNNPQDRRIIVSAWNPGELDQMALPPCHVMWQLLCDPDRRELSMCMYQRSCDMFLGIPFNIASYALLLEIIATATGYRAKKLNMFLADVHIYKNHLEQVKEQLRRKPFIPPKILLPNNGRRGMDYIETLRPEDIILVGYQSHSSIKGEMAV